MRNQMENEVMLILQHLLVENPLTQDWRELQHGGRPNGGEEQEQ